MDQKIIVPVDGYKITGPKVDGGWNLTFTLGEYAKEQLAELLSMNTVGKMLNIQINILEEQLSLEYNKDQEDTSEEQPQTNLT